jgi:hypothetical protein
MIVAALLLALFQGGSPIVRFDSREQGRKTKSQETSCALEARSAGRMHQVYLDILRRAKDTGVRLMDHYTLPRP